MKRPSSPNSVIINICQELHQKNLISAFGGNVSLRMTNKIIITPGGISLADITEDDLVVIDVQGNVLFGTHEPSSEVLMHLNIYNSRQDVYGIIHTHPTASTAFAYKNMPIQSITREGNTYLKQIPIVPFYPPGSSELAEAVGQYAKEADAILMEKHGLVTLGSDLYKAYNLTELTEEMALLNLYIHLLNIE